MLANRFGEFHLLARFAATVTNMMLLLLLLLMDPPLEQYMVR